MDLISFVLLVYTFDRRIVTREHTSASSAAGDTNATWLHLDDRMITALMNFQCRKYP
jgi:hypothetical protein